MYYSSTNPIAKELEDFWRESQSLVQQWWVEADLDVKMATNQQDYWNSFYGSSNYRNQKILMFNKILRVLNMIDGYQRDNRLATVISASDNDPDSGETADQRSTVLDWVMRGDNTYEKISDCFAGSNMCGLNLLQLYMDFREDPENGCIKSQRLPFSSFVMDPFWTKTDLSDCGRIWTRRYVSQRELLGMVPTLLKDIPALGKGYASKDGKFQYLPQNWLQYQQEMYSYDEYWTKEYKEVDKILDKSTGEVVSWKGNREQFRILRNYNPNVELIKASIPTIKLHVLVNNQLIYEEKSPYGLDRYPFAPSLCYYFPEVQNYAYRYMGITRAIRDAQIYVNRTRNNLFDMMLAQVQSGLMVKEDALVNPEDAFFQGPGKVLYFKQTANLATDVSPIPPPPVAPGWMELIQIIEKEIMDIVGPEELFAQNLGNKEMSGILMKLKMGAGLTGLRNIFDRLNDFQRQVGEIMDDMVINNFSPGKVARILGKNPTELFFDETFTKYNCMVEEAELTSSQRQLKFLQALQLKQISPEIVDDAYLLKISSLQDKKQLIENAQARSEQMQQLQQAQTMQALEHQKVLTRSFEAKTQNDFAAAEERKSRAVSNIGLAKERTSQAVHDRAASALDNAKALKELDTLDDTHLMKLANFVLDLQQKQKELEGGEEEDAVLQAKQVGSEVEQEEMMTKTQNPQPNIV